MKLLFIAFAFLVAQHKCAVDEKEFQQMRSTLAALGRQVMLQQFFSETRVRTEGQSGLKVTRLRSTGLKTYHVNTHTGYAAAAIHDHANNDRTVGMGELTAVLNGIEFKTRHNDYRLYMPHRTSKDMNAYERIPFPDVPPEVLNKTTVDGQVVEMRKWFKAYRDQDHTARDYRKYFKPVLCYLEGSWTQSGKNIDEPFASDRHFVDAKSWMELHEKSRYIAYSGTKSRFENLSFLPTKIMNMINDTIPSFAQWNYRIMCHPVKRDIPLNRIRVVEDLSSRMMGLRSILRHAKARSARFQLNFKDEPFSWKSDRAQNWETLIDEIMSEIPGKDNYQADLEDEGLEGKAMKLDRSKLNAGYYHRWFTLGADAMGSVKQHRGYNDDMMFAAMNTQEKVAGVEIEKCVKKPTKNCYTLRQKWSYAIPLEIIYLTPLYKWNPYNLTHYGDQNWKNLNIITENRKRNGDCRSADKAFRGINSRNFYMTPAAFYSGKSVDSPSAADTARGVTCILDQQGKAREVRASGTHVFLPQIKDVGILRTRYPIFPVHGEGSSAWKELNALREVTMNQEQYNYMYWTSRDLDPNAGKEITFQMGYSNLDSVARHTHEITLDVHEMLMLKGGQTLEKSSTSSNGHFHLLKIRNLWWRKDYYEFTLCDNKSQCWDKHVRQVTIKS